MFGKPKGVIKEFKNKLLIGIMIVTLLLCVCITVDYADDNITIENINSTVKQINTTNVTVLNGTQYVKGNSDDSYFVAKNSDKVYIVKEKSKEKTKIPIVTITSKPSCGCNYGYYYHTRSYIDYCPHCHHYNVLRNVHKWQARYEQELTCTNCGADYCGCCGKEKYSYSRVYLRRA